MAEVHRFEVLVVGAGLAGLTAGLFAARQGRATLVFESTAPGGHLLNVHQIEDYPGFPEGVAGYDLCPMVQEQAARFGAQFALAAVDRLDPAGNGWRVAAGGEAYEAPVVIVASGSEPRPLDVPGEARLVGRGVSHCASCDGPFHRGGAVAVVGGGDSALQEALALTEYAARVVVLHREPTLTAQQTYRQRVLDHPAVEVRSSTTVEEILGEETVGGVLVRDAASGARAPLEVTGVFVYVGLAPRTAFLRALDVLDAAGRVATDAWMRTARPGLFAVGDIRSDSAAQAITAAGDGATAAIAAHRQLANAAWPGTG